LSPIIFDIPGCRDTIVIAIACPHAKIRYRNFARPSACPPACPSICLCQSVTLGYCVKMAKHIVKIRLELRLSKNFIVDVIASSAFGGQLKCVRSTVFLLNISSIIQSSCITTRLERGMLVKCRCLAT